MAALELCDLADQKPLLEQAKVTEGTTHRAAPSRPNAMQRLADDRNGSHLINFPFAMTVFVLLILGALVMAQECYCPTSA